jgi:uncharacterized protein (DUF2336 family)
MAVQDSFIGELEDAIQSGSPEKRVETLRRVTDLFLNGADRLNEAQIGVFDDVLCHLIKRIETKAMAELSTRLAPVDNAPVEVIRKLARDNEISVAGPVLTQSARLTTSDLVEIAGTKGQAHLLAMSGRDHLETAVTDVLIDRGNREVRHTLAKNSGAQFSESGFTSLVKSAETDESLAEKVGLRLDLPIRLLRELLAKATEAVRSRLLAAAPPQVKEQVQQVLAKISSEVGREVSVARDFTEAMDTIAEMQERGELDDKAVRAFAAARKYEEVAAAIATMCAASIDLIAPLMKSERDDGLLVACKAIGLKWSTVSAILELRLTGHAIVDPEFGQAKADYLKLSQATAQRTLRFWKVRIGTSKDGAGSTAKHSAA